MTSTEFAARTAGVLERLDSVLHEISELDLTVSSDEELLDLLGGVEQRVRRLATVDHALVSETDSRGVAHERGCSSTAALLARLLRIGTGQASARVRAARQLALRRTLTGEELAAEFPATAAAQAEGAISVEHARIITTTIRALPAEVRDDKVEEIEPELAGYARRFGPDQFGKLARHLADVLAPDGTLRDAKYRERQRGLTVRQRPDGSVTGSFEGTAEFGETLLTVLDKTAAPEPAADGAKDPRTPAQRRHDGLLDGLKMLLRSGQLSDCHGVSTTIIVTLTAEQLQTGTGLAQTGHGASVPVQDVLTNIGDARIFPVVLDDDPPTTGPSTTADPPTTGPPDAGPPPETGAQLAGLFRSIRPIAAYGTTHRIFTEGQRLAMIARDKGCSFPGCTTGPAWCEANHITPWRLGKRTSVDDGALLCGFHHREFENLGWDCHMINGIPHYRPPYWIDHHRTPQRNTAHDLPATG